MPSGCCSSHIPHTPRNTESDQCREKVVSEHGRIGCDLCESRLFQSTVQIEPLWCGGRERGRADGEGGREGEEMEEESTCLSATYTVFDGCNDVIC